MHDMSTRGAEAPGGSLMLAVRWWLSLTRGVQPIVLAVRVAWLH